MVSYSDVNVLAILAAVVANMALGFLWYSPAGFGKQWMALVGKRQEDLGDPKGSIAVAALSAVVSASSLAVLFEYAGVTNWIDGLGVGALVGVGIVAMVLAVDHVFAGRSLRLYFLQATYHVVAFVLMGTILGAMQ